MKDFKIGYSTTTYRKQFYSKHLDWMKQTKKLYNEVLAFYYQILMDRPHLLSLSGYELLRTLEILTVGTKEMKTAGDLPELPLLDFPKLPLYFRRAIINAAIGMAKSFLARRSLWEEQYKMFGRETGCPQVATQFHSAPVYYQGMYRNWKEDEIELKLWTGSRWVWTVCRMKGRMLPRQGKRCSPSLKVFPKRAELHIPVEQPVMDIRKIGERVKVGESICAVSFPNQDTLAVCVHMNGQGEILHSRFLKGGTQLKHRKEILCYKEEQKNSLSPRIRKKIQRIHEAYAHQISRQIVEFAKEMQASVIVVPNYRMVNALKWVRLKEQDLYSWIGRSIIKKTAYKAFQKGILLGTVSFSKSCSNSLFVCPKGNRGNIAWNTAVNVGRNFLKSYNN